LRSDAGADGHALRTLARAPPVTRARLGYGYGFDEARALLRVYAFEWECLDGS